MSKNIIVTGGAGYIGSHTVVKLVEFGFNPIIIDNFSNSSPEIISRIELICKKKIKTYNLNCSDQKKISENINWNEIDGIIHFAAYKSVSESFKKKEEYFLKSVTKFSFRYPPVFSHKLHPLFFFDASKGAYCPLTSADYRALLATTSKL